jgi:hypothetical protein
MNDRTSARNAVSSGVKRRSMAFSSVARFSPYRPLALAWERSGRLYRQAARRRFGRMSGINLRGKSETISNNIDGIAQPRLPGVARPR